MASRATPDDKSDEPFSEDADDQPPASDAGSDPLFAALRARISQLDTEAEEVRVRPRRSMLSRDFLRNPET